MSELIEMGKSGDTRVTWDSRNQAEVENARRTFVELRAKGYLAWSVKRDGEKNEQITVFDPHAERIIMGAPMRGGR